MKTMAAFAACILGLAIARAGDQKGFAVDKLVGDWTYVEGTRDGEKVPKDHLKGVVKFDKAKVIVPSEGNEPFVMAYTIDASKTPAAIDIKIEKGPIAEAVGSTAVGVIAIDGDTLKLCYIEGKTRPTTFESTKENKTHTFVLKRAAK